jgi:hypothetical protein
MALLDLFAPQFHDRAPCDDGPCARARPPARPLCGTGIAFLRAIDQLVQTADFWVEQLTTGYMAGAKPMTFIYEGIAHRS